MPFAGARHLGRTRMRGLRGLQRIVVSGLGQDDSSINWTSVIDTGISSASQDAAVALQNPTYSAIYNPATGAYSVTSYGAPGSAGISGLGGIGGIGSSSLLPLLLIGGLGLFAVMAMQK